MEQISTTNFLNKEEIKNFSKIKNEKFIFALLQEIFAIAVIIFLSERYFNPIVYIVAIFLIGARMQGLVALMHDAAHYRASTNRFWNDFFGELVAFASPLSMQGYRNNHFIHHRELNSEKDPDWVRTRNSDYQFPKSKNEIFRLLFAYASGYKALQIMKNMDSNDIILKISPRLKRIRLGVFLGSIALSFYFHFWSQLLLYWFVPLFTTSMFFLYIRTVAEHYTNLSYENILNQSRTVVASKLELWVFAPHGVNYHLEHHLYPSVPFYRLKALHNQLMTKENYRNSAHITKGYMKGLFQESCKTVDFEQEKVIT